MVSIRLHCDALWDVTKDVEKQGYFILLIEIDSDNRKGFLAPIEFDSILDEHFILGRLADYIVMYSK